MEPRQTLAPRIFHGDRHLMLLYMLGMVDDGSTIGEDVYLSQKQQEFHKKSIRNIKNMFVSTNDHDSVFSSWQCATGYVLPSRS